MAKLYPPYIEGTIPAFYANGSTATLTVPFSMNKAVSMSDFSGIDIKIKTVQSNEFIYSATTSVTDLDYIKSSLNAKFTINLTNQTKFKIGQHYKVQIAYCDASAARTPGYYSTVGVVKFTTKPTVKIADLTDLSSHRLTYTGVYSQTKADSTVDMDVSEKVYEYCFNLYEVTPSMEDLLVATSDWQLHNSSTDIVSYESTDNYSFIYSLKPNKFYHVEYIVRTTNGLEVTSGKYTVMDKIGIPPEIDATFICKNNFDNGYVSLSFIPEDVNAHNYANGSFVLTRASSEDNFTNWYPLLRFTLRDADKLDVWEYKDFTVQHGLKYQYAIQQYNSKGLYSTKMIAINENGQKFIEPDFEDSFLYDGQRQLKIRFNPKVSSFKTDLMENKVDTIGSKYPFIFRNSRVEYKEFPISGLISYHSDEANLFMNDEDLGLATNYTSKPRSEISRTKAIETDDLYLRSRTTALTAYNIAAERIFKLAVLEWLNDGKPKLFRSPTEGNYFVRLMNVSLSPEDRTGRMIHNFQATAYEIAPCDYSTLNQYNIIYIDEPSNEQYRLITLDLSDPEVKEYYAESSWGEEQIQSLIYQQSLTLSNLRMQLAIAEQQRQAAESRYHNDPSDENWNRLEQAHNRIERLNQQIIEADQEAYRLSRLTTYKKYNQHDIVEYIEFRDCIPGTIFYIFDSTTGSEFSVAIGVTGSYIVSMKDHIFTSIRVDDNVEEPAFGLITYKYYAVEENNFENVYDIEYEQTIARQFIGKNGQIYNGDSREIIIDKNLPKDKINDIKRTLISFYYIHFTARIVEEIYEDTDKQIWQWKKTGTTISERQGNRIDIDDLSPLMIYKVYKGLNEWQYRERRYNTSTRQYDWNFISEIDYTIKVDDNIIRLEPDYEEELLNHLIQFFDNETFDYLSIGSGIVLDCAYTSSICVYNIENTDNDLQALMRSYLDRLERYNNPSDTACYQSQEFYDSTIVPAWNAYCNLLQRKLEE